jgi:lysophospholipase L1-like esterase
MERFGVNRKRKLFNLLAWAIMAWGLIFPATAAAEPYLQDASGLVSMETENFDANVPNGAGSQWALDYTSGYSGSGAMKAPAAISYKTDYVQNSPRLDYYVNFAYNGTHYLWVRAYATSTGSDSLHAGLNGGMAAGGNDLGFAAAGSYVWARTTVTVPSVGVHTVNLWVREKSAVVDKVVLATNSSYTPSGFGPPESLRGEGAGTVSAPVIDPAGGNFANGVTVTLSTATPFADIYYTLDGSSPTATSTRYISPFLLSANATVKAKAMLSGYNDSSIVSAVFTISSDSSNGTGAFLQDSSGMVSMETENFDANVPNGAGSQWALDYTTGYSGRGAMKAPAALSYKTDYVQNSPRLDYYVNFAYNGTHYLWVRAYATSTGSDSLHAGLNGGTAAGGNDLGFAAVGSYVWARTTVTVPSVGVHTVNLWVREKSAVVDKVVLTTNSNYTPSGFGPAESARGFSCLTIPSVFILSPEAGHLQTHQDLRITTQTCLDSALHAGWGVKIELEGPISNGSLVAVVKSPPYATIFSGLALGEYSVVVAIVDSAGNPVVGVDNQDYVDRVAIGDYYVAIGDSITDGYGDDFAGDDVSLDGRNSGGGFTPTLNNLLTDLTGYPHTVVNEGVAGTSSSDGLINLPVVLERHPDSQRFLVKFGMNDARPWVPVPSGLGLWPGESGYPGTFKDNMQRIIDLIRNNGKESLIAKINIALGNKADGPKYSDPNTGARSLLIQEYNQVVDELFGANADIMFVPPDFYEYFAVYYPSEYYDNIHPNGTGYRSMAEIWFDILTLPAYRRGDPPGGTEAYVQDSSGLVSMETENFDANVPNGAGSQWALDYTTGYSGKGAMKAPAAISYKTDYVQNSPRLDYYVNFAYNGTHYLWVRAYATSTGSDSLHAGLNGGTAAGGNDLGFAAAGSYVWAKTTLRVPSVGVHTVNLWVREKSAVVDKVVLTTNSSYTPSGFGPAESARGYF